MNSSILMNRIADDRRCLAHFRGSSHELMIKQDRHWFTWRLSYLPILWRMYRRPNSLSL